MLGGIGTWEILLIFLVALLLFGAKRIPEIAKGLGKGITEFKHAVKDVQGEIENSVESATPPPTSEPQPPPPEASTESNSETTKP